MALRTDYKDDILDLTQNTKRKYRMVTNADGTVSFEDMTVYSQIGDSFGAAELNEIANVVNEGGSNMYYDPATDIKYLRNQDGEWVEVGTGGLLEQYLYSGIANEANFKSSDCNGYGVAANVNIGAKLTVSYNKTQTGSGSFTAVSDYVDFTNYTKLKFTHSSSIPKASSYHNVRIVLAESLSASLTPVLTSYMISPNTVTSASGEIEIDVSAVSGECYIIIALASNETGTYKTEISNMYLSR